MQRRGLKLSSAPEGPGYWERRGSGQDALGVVSSDLAHHTGFGVDHGGLVYVQKDAVFEVTGDLIAGPSSDPVSLTRWQIDKLFSTIQYDSHSVRAATENYNRRCIAVLTRR